MADRPRNVNRPSGVCSRTRLVRANEARRSPLRDPDPNRFANSSEVRSHRLPPFDPLNDRGHLVVPLGVDDQLGQSGSRQALYEFTGIDAGQIVNAALLALKLAEGAVEPADRRVWMT